MRNHSARLFKFQNDRTARLTSLVFCLLVAGFVSSPLHQTNAQTPSVLYTWASPGVQDWFKNFGAANTSATLANPGPGALVITETSTAAGGSQAFSDGFNTIRDTPASFGSGCCGGIDLTGLSALEFDMGHNGPNPVNVQFFVQASPGANYVALGPDLAVLPGINTYSLPLTGLTADQIAYIRTIGINIRDHSADGNLTWTIQEVRSAGTPLTSRVIADHDGGAADFDGVICNFDCGAVSGGDGGQDHSGMSVVGNALEWTDLGGGPGVAITYGNGTQNSGGGFNARPVDLSNYDIATIRMKATGTDASVFVQFYMQTGSGFNYQAVNWGNLPVDGSYHDLVIPLAGITSRNFVDTSGINLGGHASDLVIDIDSVIYSVNPPTPCLQVVKQCAYPPNSPTCFPAGANIDFVGYVTNCGALRLTNVTIVDCRPLLGAGLLDTSGSPLIQPLALDPGQVIAFRGSFAPTLDETCAQGATNCITVRGTDITAIGASVTNSTSTTCAICVNPCLAVTKVCSTNLVLLCGSNSSSIGFSGIVSNCGNIMLTNVVLTDDLTAGVVLRLGSLAAGATAPWSTNLPVTAALCGRSNIVNTVTAVGANFCNPAQVVTNRANCSFTVACPSPSITITKACASPIVTNIGSSLTVTGQVCNTGAIDFDNVVVVDSQPSGVTPTATNNLGSLAAGQCKPYSFTYTATSCDPNHDTVTAFGSTACGGAPTVATASADCFLCCPGISIQSLLACLQPGATCPPSEASYGRTATGVLGTTGDPTQDNPAFCYIVVVRNTGHDPLTNIVIHDDQLGALGTFPGPLAVGGTITISNLRTNWGATTTNFTSVSAQCGGVHANGAVVGATTNLVATVIQAGITCQKLVSVNGGPPAQSLTNDCSGGTNVITWYVAVTNSGEAILCNIVISELGIGPDLLPCGAVNLALTNCLAPGDGTGLIPVCTSVYGCAETNIQNSLRVTGTVAAISNVCAVNITGSNIVAESQCAASVTLRRGLTITKACASGILTNVGSSLTVTGMVCNVGDQDLTNIIIFDSQPGLPLAATNVIDLLPAGQCSGYSFTYTATSCDPNHDVVTAIGTALSGARVGPVSASADCFLCCPGISLQALVGCLQPGATCPASGASYSTNATGVKGDTGAGAVVDDPAFCYIVVVRNTGHDPLTNIVIFDDQLGALGTFPGPLAVGGTITISNLRTNWDTTTTNTTTVSAQCDGVHANGAAVGASASAIATVIQAGLEAHKLVSVNGSTPVHVATPVCGTIASNITWYVNVTNTGEAVLCNIVVTELGLGPDLLPCGAVSIALTNCLAPGQETGLIPLCTSGFNTCVATNLENSIRVTAQAAAISNVCAINITGSNIVVQSQCSADLSLCCAPAVPQPGCRVTGGGRQDSPETCPDDVRFVTHGGQVGGPFGSLTCIVTLDQLDGNRCIQGRWTHVRHTTGGLEGNFHARIFDTLACACLGDSFANTNTCEYEQGVVTNGICNPVEANGPSNGRLGPANKIAFTGVGEWIDPQGRRPQSVLFRVDIEDRGEPGGSKPIDGQRPADRYRMRIWVLTPDEVLRLNDPTDGLINIPAVCDSCTTVSRNAIRACLGITFQDGVCGPNTCAANPGDQTCFTLPDSIPVRLPDIDDGGELKNGNEQIHPQLKICP